MGEITEMMLDGTLDEQTGEYIGEAVGYPRRNKTKRHRDNFVETPAEIRARKIRKEIALDIKNGKSLQDARRDANIKHGKGWRNIM
jgi:hypothetical protein